VVGVVGSSIALWFVIPRQTVLASREVNVVGPAVESAVPTDISFRRAGSLVTLRAGIVTADPGWPEKPHTAPRIFAPTPVLAAWAAFASVSRIVVRSPAV
jgi:hypothetical protein